MKETVYTVKELADKEIELNLYDGNILGIPIWRLLRFNLRTAYFKRHIGYNNKSNKKESINLLSLIRCYFNSFFKLIKLLLSSERHNNVIFAFPRLAKLDNVYLDKFTDPIIEYTDLKNDFLIFQRSLGGLHRTPRQNQKATIETDFIDITAKILAIILFPLFFLKYAKTILHTYRKSKNLFGMNFSFLIKASIDLGEFYFKHYFVKLILLKLQSKHIFVVNRGVFTPVIVAARKVNAYVYELQHGVTLSDTILYAGKFHPLADPDRFLVFGEKWIAPQFYMPLDKILNIGWGYRKMLNKNLKTTKPSNNQILVISSPSCTFKLFELVVELARSFLDYEFHIRLHPQEGYKELQYKTIDQMNNIKLNDQAIDSAVVINQFKYLVGENSSVMYEALSLNKNVARLAMGGLEIKDQNDTAVNGFWYINNFDDFKNFLNAKEEVDNANESGIYDNFDDSVVNKLIKN